LLTLSSIEYNLFYAIVLFFVCSADSRLHRNWGVQGALDGALSPLLSPDRESQYRSKSSLLTGLTSGINAGASNLGLGTDEAMGSLPAFVLELMADLSVVIIQSSQIEMHRKVGQGGFGEVSA
jgi:hypothetical protein